MRILIGYDGSECAEAALDDLARAGLPGGTEALVLSVAELMPLAATQMMPAAYPIADPSEASVLPAAAAMEAVQKAAEEHARRAAMKLQQMFPDWRIGAEVGNDSPGHALVSRAQTWNADLIVIGSHGRSRLARLVLGSVSQMVVTHASCSTRVVRAVENRSPGAPRVMIGIDTSPHSAMAVEAVSGRTWPAQTQVRVLTVMDHHSASLFGHAAPPRHGGSAASPQESAKDWARRALDEAVKELHAAGLDASATIIDGSATDALLAEAQAWPADCIFLGAKGHSRIERLLLGSVSSSVAARAHCSVEIVRMDVA